MWFKRDDDRIEDGKAFAPPPVRSRAADRIPEKPLTATQVLAFGGSTAGVSGTASSHIQTYADVPRFLRVLSAGARAVVSLPKEEQAHVAVVELPGRAALVMHADIDPAQLESIKGKLREEGFNLRVTSGETDVIAAIYQGAGEHQESNGAARNSNQYVEAIDQWIQYALDNRATDIHLETRGSSGTVKFRIDGEVEEMRAENAGAYTGLFLEKCMSSLFNNDQQTKSGSDSLFDKEKYLYCMVPYSERGQSLKLRYQSLRGNEGPKTVLRLLHVDETQPTKSFDELGYSASHVALWKQAMDTPSGLVLIAGVTGSGKSTSQKSFIELNPHTAHSAVYTIEDPVEYPIRGAHQIPIQRDLSNPEESAKRYSETIAALMRADPDIVMLGEIRDRFSSNAAQQLAETGHMGLGTVHAHLLSGIVPRLVNEEIGMNREILTAPNMATLFAYQALVPKLCPHCAMTTSEAVVKDEGIAAIVSHIDALLLEAAPMRWKRVAGCGRCNNRGTVGLTVAAEMLMPDEDWLRAIREGRDTEAVEIYRSHSNRDLNSPDMTGKTVFEHTLYKALQGQVDARQCSRFEAWHRYMGRAARTKRQ